MSLLGDTIETPHQLFVHKLGAALTMEDTILGMLDKLQAEARSTTLRQQLQQHRKETQQQIDNLLRCFDALGEDPDRQPCPAIEGLEKEGTAMLRQVDERLADSVILSAVIETEHHEVAVYDNLIIQAEVIGEADVIALLNENLEQEDATLEKAVKASEQLAKELAGQAA
jgi:ferritin-like metal-binding protein YciE